MNLLITGAGGQLGRELIKSAASQAINTTALTRSQLDVTNAAAVQRTLICSKANLVINAAAYTAVDLAETHPEQAFAVNTQGPANLAISCKALDIPLFHVSSDFVYSGYNRQANSETSPTEPINIYGKSKLEGDKLIQTTWFKHLILRSAWIFSEQGDNFANHLMRAAEGAGILTVVEDQYGNPTYAGDLADTLIALAIRYKNDGQLPWGLYNYAGTPSVSRLDFARAILHSVINRDGQGIQLIGVNSSTLTGVAKRPLNSSLDCSKFESIFNIQAPDWRSKLPKEGHFIGNPSTPLTHD